ncbi:MAG: PilZ domain-containing protein [Candidatus Omnitrophica bacterium]|nr:PilZ domain-containing protein [Candidatus Omnitrophota bacterium]
MTERRKTKRIKLSAVAQWKKFTANPEGTPGYPAIIKNISTAGACFSSYIELNINDKIRLQIKIPSRKTVDLKCEIIWVEKISMGDADRSRYDVGVKIVDISNENLEEINKFTFLHFFNS